MFYGSLFPSLVGIEGAPGAFMNEYDLIGGYPGSPGATGAPESAFIFG